MSVAVIGGSREADRLRARLPGATLIDPEGLPDRFDADAVIDACHPCERETPHAVAARVGDIPLLRLRRPPWQAEAGDDWIDVADATAACDVLRADWHRVFLCLGEADRVPFAPDADRWYLVRTRRADAPRPPHSDVTEKAGPFTVSQERALMQARGINVLVTRNAGGQGALPKILAARALGLPVVMLARPARLSAEVSRIEEALAWLDSLSLP